MILNAQTAAFLGILALALPVLVACGGSDGQAAGQESAGDGEMTIEEDIRSSGSVPAKDWLRREDTVLWEGSKAEALALIDELLSYGATNVYMTGVSSLEDEESGSASRVELSASMAVELPAAKAERGLIFDRVNRHLAAVELETVADKGQKYIEVIYD